MFEGDPVGHRKPPSVRESMCGQISVGTNYDYIISQISNFAMSKGRFFLRRRLSSLFVYSAEEGDRQTALKCRRLP